jgi:hypothetical protein
MSSRWKKEGTVRLFARANCASPAYVNGARKTGGDPRPSRWPTIASTRLDELLKQACHDKCGFFLLE